MLSPDAGFSMTRTGGAPPLTVGAAAVGGMAGAALPETFTWTCLNHQPLPGVWTYTDRVCGPGLSAPDGIAAPKPDASQNGLASAAATSGRLCANTAFANILPPPSMLP